MTGYEYAPLLDRPQMRPKSDRRNFTARDQVLGGVHQSFSTLPTLRLTVSQAARLFHLRREVCERVLETLTEEGRLLRDASGQYHLAPQAQLAARRARQSSMTRPEAALPARRRLSS